jgi:presenilin-like A22 family membrane protease
MKKLAILTNWALGALVLQFLDLSVGFNNVILKQSHWALSVLVGDLLGLGVNLLFSLTFATFEIHECDHIALGDDAGFLDGTFIN